MKDRIDNLPGVIRHSSFDPGFAGEAADNVPRFVSFSVASEFNFGPEVLEGWQQALLAECDHQQTSNFRKYHEPVVFRATTELNYRRRLLDRAFPPHPHSSVQPDAPGPDGHQGHKAGVKANRSC